MLMTRLELQNGFRCGGDAHHGIASGLTISALHKVVIYNVRVVVRGEKRAPNSARMGRCGRTVDILLSRPLNTYYDGETISIRPPSRRSDSRRKR